MQINRPAPTYSAGPTVNEIDQRWRALRSSMPLNVNPAINDFLDRDVARLMTIARAAYALSAATNAESYRQATQQLMSALRLP